MKNIVLSLLIVAFFCSSCSHQIIPIETFEGNYQKRMLSNSNKEIKANVTIFTSERDIKDSFEVVSVNVYSPWFSIPIIYSSQKQMKLKFYKKAATKAYEAGCNGVLIEGIGRYKVLNVHSGISVQTLSDKFADGTIANAIDKQRKTYYDSYFLEISRDITNVSKNSDINKIKQKIQVFEEYNKSLSKPNKKVDKYIKVLKTRVSLKEYELLRQEQINAKRAAKEDNNLNYDVDRISQMFLAQRFEDGTVLSARDGLQENYVDLFIDEIKDNTKAATTIEHLELISRKISILDDYCKKSKKSFKYSMKIKMLESSVASKQKSIEKKK